MFLLDEIAPFKPLLAPHFERMNLKEFVNYRNLLYQKQYFFQNPHLDLVEEAITYLLEFVTELPELSAPSPFTIPLFSAYSNLGETTRKILTVFGHAPYQDRGIFKELAETLGQNLVKESPSEMRRRLSRKSNSTRQTRPRSLRTFSLESAALGGSLALARA